MGKNPIVDFPQVGLKDVRMMENKALMYVVTEDHQLVLSQTRWPTKFERPGWKMLTDEIYHSDLAKLKPVLAAGDLYVKDGIISLIDTKSGHFLVHGDHLNKLVTKIFVREGFTEAPIAFRDYFLTPDPRAIIVNQHLPPLGKGTGILNGIIDIGNQEKKNEFGSEFDPWSLANVNLNDFDRLDMKRYGFDGDDFENPLGISENASVFDNFDSDDFDEEDYSDKIKEFPDKVIAAMESYYQLVPLAGEYYLKTSSEEPQLEWRESLAHIAKPLQEFGEFGSRLSQLSIMVGGHKRTWNGIAAASQSCLTIASSLTQLAAAKTFMSLGALTGGIGLAIGAISLVMSLSGSDEDDDGNDALKQLHESIIELHRTMIECFQKLEEILMVSVITRLNQINYKLDRLESITAQSFKELHTKDLIDILDVIKKEICNEHTLTPSKKQSYLRKLTSWIDNHPLGATL